MATSQKVTADLENLQAEMPLLAKVALNKVALDLVGDFTEASPVASGLFKAEWDMKSEKGGVGVMAQVVIFNRMPYAAVLEEGSPVGSAPWPSVGEKTVEEDGRIWSKQAVGGVVAPILAGEYADVIASKIGEFVFGGI